MKKLKPKLELESYDVDGNFKALTLYLLESTVNSVWTADVKAQEHGIRVAVTKWPHVVIVRRTCNETHENPTTSKSNEPNAMANLRPGAKDEGKDELSSSH